MATDGHTQERRRHPREPVAWPVRLWVDEESIVGRIVDVSASGFFIATAPTAALKSGASCRIEVVAGTPNPFTVDGEIRHAGDRGVGLETKAPLPVRWSE